MSEQRRQQSQDAGGSSPPAAPVAPMYPTLAEISVHQCKNVLTEVIRINTKGYKGLDPDRPPIRRTLQPGQAIAVWMSSFPFEGVVLMAKAALDAEAEYNLAEGELMAQLEDLATGGLKYETTGPILEAGGIKWMFTKLTPTDEINEMYLKWDKLEGEAMKNRGLEKSAAQPTSPTESSDEESSDDDEESEESEKD